MRSSAARMKRKTGTATAVAHRAMWLLNRPTVRLRKVTILGPRTYLRLASSWANIQTSIPSTCPMIAPATPRQPNTIPRTVGGIHVERETTRSSPGARQSHAAIRVPAAPSRGMSWRRPAKPAMPTRVEAAMSSMGPSDVKQRRQGTIGCVSRPETAGAWTRPRYIRPMILGMSIATYTLLHTVLSLVVLVAQLFKRIPVLFLLAPTQSEPPFALTQVLVLALFVWLGVVAVRGFRPARSPAPPHTV